MKYWVLIISALISLPTLACRLVCSGAGESDRMLILCDKASSQDTYDVVSMESGILKDGDKNLFKKLTCNFDKANPYLSDCHSKAESKKIRVQTSLEVVYSPKNENAFPVKIRFKGTVEDASSQRVVFDERYQMSAKDENSSECLVNIDR